MFTAALREKKRFIMKDNFFVGYSDSYDSFRLIDEARLCHIAVIVAITVNERVTRSAKTLTHNSTSTPET